MARRIVTAREQVDLLSPWLRHASWSQQDGGYTHPSGFKVLPSHDKPDHHQLWAPAVGGGLSKVKLPHRDPRVLMDWADSTQRGH